MRTKNTRLFPTAFMYGQSTDGDWFLSVILKATFRLEHRSSPARLAERQLPILTEDEPYDGADPAGPLKFESDLVPYKPRTDVLLVGSAHTPFGRPQRYVDVNIAVGPVRKLLRVFGERRWSFTDIKQVAPIVAGPADFSVMPLTWARAYGGIDKRAELRPDVPAFRPWCAQNFQGQGFCGAYSIESIHERPLPNLEDPRSLISGWNSYPRPAGCGYYPRNSEPRVRYQGTYDDQWKAELAPRPPKDFCFDYYNAADPELQVQGYLVGNERGLLENATPGGGRIDFLLPCIRPRFTVTRSSDATVTRGSDATVTRGSDAAKQPVFEAPASLDTLLLIPDEKVFAVIWRAIIAPCVPEETDVEEVLIEYDELPWVEAVQ